MENFHIKLSEAGGGWETHQSSQKPLEGAREKVNLVVANEKWRRWGLETRQRAIKEEELEKMG